MEQKELDQFLKENLETGRIRLSKSPMASPVFFIKKKDSTVTTSNNSDFTVVIVTVSSASGSLKAEPKECLTGKGQVLSKGLRV